MPAAIILLLRQIVMALITGIGVTAVQSLFDGTIKELVFEIRDKEGVTEQDAKDIVHNMVVDVLINSAASFLLVKAKIPTKTAQYLGLTTSSPKKKALSAAATAATTKLAKDGGKAAATSVIPKIFKIAAIPGTLIWLVSAIANIVEPGIYKPSQTNAVYKKLGIPFQYPETESQLQPGPFDGAAFRDYAKAVETAGVKGIENPIALQSQLYSRQALADVINYVYGQEVVKGNAPSAKQLIPMLAKYLVGGTSVKVPTTTTTSPTTGATTTTTVKVFTGVVSQGVVGQGLSFQARPDDLIENVSELKSAAANNLAPFLAALPAKVTYEIKVVSSIVTANGFRQTGTTQRIQTGTNRDGSAKYKTVTNKFATLILYILTDRGTRTKLSTVVLGPVDSARFTVSSNDLITLAQELPKIVTTTDINEVSNISNTNTPVSPTIQTVPDGQVQTKVEDNVDTGYRFYVFETNGEEYLEVLPWVGNIPVGYTPISKQEFLARELKKTSENPTRWQPYFADIRRRNPNAFSGGISGYIMVNGVPMVNPERYEVIFNPATNKWSVDDKVLNISKEYDTRAAAFDAAGQTDTNVSGAATLREYYEAKGQTLPSVEERSVLYESLGLGQRAYYVGTAEQNSKLLSALKAK